MTQIMNGIRNHFTRTVLTSAAMLFLSTGVMAAQHSFTPEEVADGGRIYGASCASCHGPRGDGVSGAPIMSGNFKRASSDDDLIKLLRNGIPNTTMQAQRDLSETQARHCLSSIDGLVLEFR